MRESVRAERDFPTQFLHQRCPPFRFYVKHVKRKYVPLPAILLVRRFCGGVAGLSAFFLAGLLTKFSRMKTPLF